MTNETDIAAKFWKALKSDRTLMLGLAGVDEGHTQPMTAQLEEDGDHGPLWFFTAKDSDLVRAMSDSHRAIAQFAAKGHELFACLHGELVLDNNRANIDRLWNRFVAAWFKGGKDDPNLALIRLEPEHAQVWLNENSLFAGVEILLGGDPIRQYKDKVADVDLRRS